MPTAKISPAGSVGIIAGGGTLPRMTALQAQAAGWRVFIVRLIGHADDSELMQFPGIDARPEQLGFIFKSLKRHAIQDLVLIGRVRRPSLLELRPDWTTLRLLPSIAPVMRGGGDDALLRTIRSVLERRGFRLHGIQDYVRDLTAPRGIIGQIAPSEIARADIKRGAVVVKTLGMIDVGQAAVIQQGIVLGVEGAEGTDGLIERCALYRRAGSGPILVKMAKPQQDRALDMPTIGPDTVIRAINSGFSGIAVQAGATLIADTGTVVDLANAHGLFLIGIEGTGL